MQRSSDELQRLFATNGFVVIDLECDTALLDGIVSDLSPYWAGARPPRVSYADSARIQDAWRISQNVFSLAQYAPLLRLLNVLYGAQPKPFQTLNFPYGTEQLAHCDSIHFNSEPFAMMCGVWVALEDIGPDQGPLLYYPGSQKLPEYNFPDFDLPADYQHYAAYETRIAELIAQHKMEPTYGVVRKGQAIIWAANLMHGGAPQLNKSLSRHSQVTHYYFSNCRYWRPGYSANQRHYFEPSWLSYRETRPWGWPWRLRRRVVGRLRRWVSER